MTRRILILVIALGSTAALLLAVGIAVVVAALSAGPEEQAEGPWTGAPYGEPVSYAVDDGRLVQADDGAAADPDLDGVWSLLADIAGERADRIATVDVSDDEDESTMASMARDAEDPALWHAEINMAWALDPAELERTLVHEYAHMMSLSEDDAGEVSGACPTFQYSEGCLDDDAVLTRFLDTFWAGDPEGAVDESADEDDATERWEDADGSRGFVSEYAATNGAEDFAESFATFVIDWPTLDVPEGSTAAAKVRFLADDPAMDAERDRIRGVLGLG